MTTPSGTGPADRERLATLVRRSNAGLHTAIHDFVDSGHRHINHALRQALPPDAIVRRFLDELQLMDDYAGTSYRVWTISRDGLSTLQRAQGQPFIDLGALCAFVLPGHAAEWATRANAVGAHRDEDTQQVFSIFDETVPQKNLSTGQCADLVAVPPGLPLVLKALRVVAVELPTGANRECIVAHFARAEWPSLPPYDLYSGRLLR